MAYDRELADRIREALAGVTQVREVRMFGGLSFMVNGKIAVTANAGGQLMVRCDPDRIEALLEREGATFAPGTTDPPLGRGCRPAAAPRCVFTPRFISKHFVN